MPINGSFEREYQSSSNYWGDKPSSVILRSQESLVPGSVLDIGAGDGRNSLYLASQGFTVHALDVSRTGLKNLQKRARSNNLSHAVTTTVADFLTYTPTRTYDNIITNFTIHFIGAHNIQSFVQKMMDTTNPSGVNVIDDFTKNGPINHPPEDFIDQHTIGDMYLSQGWEIISSERRQVQTKKYETPGKPYVHEALGFVAKKPEL